MMMSNWLTRLFGQIANGQTDEMANHNPISERVFESIIPIAGMYGLDFGNFDPRWFANAESQ